MFRKIRAHQVFRLKQKRRTNENYAKNKDSVIKLCESAEQLDAALEFIEENIYPKITDA